MRRRHKRSFATRLRVFWVFIVLIVAVAGAATYVSYLLVTLPALRVHAVAVSIDGSAVSEREVLRAANIDRDANIWLLDTARIAARVAAIPYVDTAIVRRSPPARITIAVTLREPAACVQSGAQMVTIDASRRILQTGCARPSALRIALSGASLGPPGTVAASPAVASLLADGRVLNVADVGIRSIRQDAFGQLVAVGAGGVELLFGDEADLAQKARLVAPVLAAAPRGRAIRSIDLRAPATPTVEFR
jgi:cell division protein FtsQ